MKSEIKSEEKITNDGDEHGKGDQDHGEQQVLADKGQGGAVGGDDLDL